MTRSAPSRRHVQAIFPGQPQSQPHALDFGYFEDQLIVTYTSGNTLVILNGPTNVLQTIAEDGTGASGLLVSAYQERSGRVAAASSSIVYIYGLREEVKGTLRWTKELEIITNPEQYISTLSWGSDSELLLGTSTSLSLYNTALPSQPSSPTALSRPKTPAAPAPVWTRPIPSSPSEALFSPSASLIATLTPYSTLVKLWRRLSFESPQFDFAYLRHPDTVTHIEWRRTSDDEDVHTHDNDVLFTVCADGVFRVWKQVNPHGVEILSLYAEIDLVGAVQPRHPISDGGRERWVAVLGSAAVKRLASSSGDSAQGKAAHAEEHFKEMMDREPDVVVIADGHGHLSAWGIESVGCKRRGSEPDLLANPFHISHREGLDLGIRDDLKQEEQYSLMRILSISSDRGEVALLTHHFDGRITWSQMSFRDMLSASSRKSVTESHITWTGHTSAIKKVIRTASGKALISRTEENVGIVWRQQQDTVLSRQSTVHLQEHIHRVVLLRDGDFLVCLHHAKLSLWDTRGPDAIEIATCSFTMSEKPLCLLVLPSTDPRSDMVYIASIAADANGVAWKVKLPDPALTNGHSRAESVLEQVATFKLDGAEDMAYILPVDPAGGQIKAADFLDVFAHDVAMSYTSSGLLQTYTARVEHQEGTVSFLHTARLETGIQDPVLGSATSIRRAALVDSSKKRLTIWDTRGARLDHEEVYSEDVHDLDWAATSFGQSVLAVGFSRHIHIYSQLRYDYVSDRPAWMRIKSIQVPASNPRSIGDSVWSGHGHLVIGAGNQLQVSPSSIDLRKDLPRELQTSIPNSNATELFEIVDRMNSPLPVYHPQLITQLVLAGRLEIVLRILSRFLEVSKFYTEGEDLDPLLGFDIDDLISSHITGGAAGQALSTMSETLSTELNDLLMQKSIPQLTSADQLSLAATIECISDLSKHSRSLDQNGCRFYLFWQLATLRSHQQPRDGTSKPSLPTISWREAAFAYHSTSQDILTSLITSHAPNQQLTSSLATQSKLFIWLTSRAALLTQFEALARTAYATSSPRDPVDCALHYLALRKKAVLVGLWRTATWHREQGPTLKLLRNDFSEPRWRTAALKNAYALMGKRRFKYAAAFFLLADDLRGAMGVLAGQAGDVEFALTVGRVYGGDDCAEVKDLVRDKMLVDAVRRGDRWKASWAFWFLGDKGRAVRGLITPLEHVWPVETEEGDKEAEDMSLRAKSFLNEDPALVVMYEQLRAASLQTLKGALLVEDREEWAFVTRTAGLLKRMGCDILALDLVRNWEFLRIEPQRSAAGAEEAEESVSDLPASPSANRDFDPRKLLRRRSSLVVDDLHEAAGQQKVPNLLDGFGASSDAPAVKPRSLLDDFGFGGGSSDVKESTPQSQPPSMLDGFQYSPPMAAKKEEEKKKQPIPFKEPDANSIFDNFNF